MKKKDIPVTALTEAKHIYTNRLCKLLENELYEGIKSIWLTCKKEKNCLKQFQKKLESVPTWNTLILDEEIKRIKSKIKYDYFDKLIDAIFITNAKILTSISNSKMKIKVNIPTTSKFIHHCYISLAYNLYTDPYLIDDRIKNYQELQNNFKTLMSIIKNSIKETIENLLPMDVLLDSCLVDNLNSDTDDSDNNNSDNENSDNENSGNNNSDNENSGNNLSPNLNVSQGDTISEVVDNYYQHVENEEELEKKEPEEDEKESEEEYEGKSEQELEEENIVVNLSNYNENEKDRKVEEEKTEEVSYKEYTENKEMYKTPTFFD